MNRFFPGARRRAGAPSSCHTRLRLTRLEERETPAGGLVASGSAPGAEPLVSVARPDGSVLARFLAYDEGFRGGVSAAVGQFGGGPGTVEVVTGAGAGGGPQVNLFRVSAATGAVTPMGGFFAYNPAFAGGVRVAAGDFNGDGTDDIVTGAGLGGAPHVKVFDGRSLRVLRSFLAFDPAFRGGVSVAAGELDGNTADGPELAVAAGPGGGPHVRVLHAAGSPFEDFFAFPTTFTGGVTLGPAGANRLVAGAGQPGSVVAAVRFIFVANGPFAAAPLDPHTLPGLTAGTTPATTPAPLADAGNAYWDQRNAQNQARAAQGHANVLFLGDSITDLLQNGVGRPVWDAHFAPLGSADFAVALTTTAHVLWQVLAGQAAAVTPDVIVLLIGTNNLGTGQSPADTAAGIATIVNLLELQLPQTRIVLTGLLPRGQTPSEPLRAQIADVNRRLAPLGDGHRVRYVDLGPAFLQPDGTIAPAVMPDFAHPSEWGYDLFTLALWPTLRAALQGP